MLVNLGRRQFFNTVSITAASTVSVLATGSLDALAAAESTVDKHAMSHADASRILLLNPNSSDDFTKLILREAKRVASANVEVVAVTSPFGPKYVGSWASTAIAGHALVDTLARVLEKDSAFDAAIIAGFGVGNTLPLQELAPFPIVGMLEASVSAALMYGGRFSVLTGGARWVPMLKKQIEDAGLGSRLASVRAIPLTGAEIVADQNRALNMLAELSERCGTEDGATCVIHGGAAVAGMARLLADRVTIPMIDNVAISVATAEMLARVVTRPKKSSKDLPPQIDSVGLSDALKDRIKNPR